MFLVAQIFEWLIWVNIEFQTFQIMTKLTKMQQFYKDKSIFITGASGFMGKVLLEKLLYSCSDVKQIMILVRPKRGKSAAQRVQDFSTLPVSLMKLLIRDHKDLQAISLVSVNQSNLWISKVSHFLTSKEIAQFRNNRRKRFMLKIMMFVNSPCDENKCWAHLKSELRAS